MRDNVEIFDVRNLLIQRRELVKMCGEQAECMYLRRNVSERNRRLAFYLKDKNNMLTLRLPTQDQTRRTSRFLSECQVNILRFSGQQQRTSAQLVDDNKRVLCCRL